VGVVSAFADALGPRLAHWAEANVAPSATVVDVAPMPGHAGLSFGFTVDSGASSRRLVARFAPPGVARKGNTDVLRQVPLLGALEKAGIPIAPLVWWTDDPSWFGTDAIIQEFLTGGPLHMYDPAAGVSAIDGDVGPYVRRAVEAIAAVHRLDWQTALPDWEQTRTMTRELEFWERLLERVDEQQWRVAGQRLVAALRATDPGGHEIGLFHGDYQTNNILFDHDDGRLRAIVDWEIAGIGPVDLDVAWLSMMTDTRAWDPARAGTMQVRVDPAQIRSWYEGASGRQLVDFDWYCAYACFRYGSIAGFNVRLHRTGRRIDPENELIAPSVPTLFARGLELLGA
jgi:aminoglycoside phosphotransferase (APT) family kinase protein